jgi:hypothetical protein
MNLQQRLGRAKADTAHLDDIGLQGVVGQILAYGRERPGGTGAQSARPCPDEHGGTGQTVTAKRRQLFQLG